MAPAPNVPNATSGSAFPLDGPAPVDFSPGVGSIRVLAGRDTFGFETDEAGFGQLSGGFRVHRGDEDSWALDASEANVQGRATQDALAPLPATLVIVRFDGVSVTLTLVSVSSGAVADSSAADTTCVTGASASNDRRAARTCSR